MELYCFLSDNSRAGVGSPGGTTGVRADVETPSNSPPLHQFVLPVNAFDAFPGPFAILSACRNFGQFCFHSMHQRPQFR